MLSFTGSKKVTLKKQVNSSVEWACLENSETVLVSEFIEKVEKGETKDYLFDWSLPLYCQELSEQLKIPSFFNGS